MSRRPIRRRSVREPCVLARVATRKTATTFMWWTRKSSLSLVLLLWACSIETALAAEPCGPRTGTTLRYVDVFDGRPEELAYLMPDEANKSSGHWRLGYVYDA